MTANRRGYRCDALASALLALAACAEPAPAPCCLAAQADAAAQASAADAASATLAAAPLDGDSVYQVDAAWQDAQGRSLRLAALRGRPVAIAMMFTHCQYACPRLVEDLKRIERALTPAERGRTAFVLVSMDDVRDTPARLAAFAAEKRLIAPTWTLLRGEPADVALLNAVLGGRYKRTPSGDFAHSNLIVVLDGEGRIVHRQEGLGAAPEPSLAALRRAMTGAGAPGSRGRE